jgi:hypothetical protein
MRAFLFATAALSVAAAAPASAQMAGDPMMPAGPQSCVMNGQFVPCPPGGGMRADGMAPNPFMVPGMAVGAAAGAAAGVVGGAAVGAGAGMAAGAEAMDPRMERRMTARERREQRRMMRQQSM